MFASVSEDFPDRVDLRQYFVPEDSAKLTPTRRGINLKYHEWKVLKEAQKKLEEVLPAIKETVPCFLTTGHNGEGILQCKECSPNAMSAW